MRAGRDEDIYNRNKARWMKQKGTSRMSCDQSISWQLEKTLQKNCNEMKILKEFAKKVKRIKQGMNILKQQQKLN